MTIVTIWVL